MPVAMYFYFRKQKKADRMPFWIGCITFVLFALVLEQLAYLPLTKMPFWKPLTSNVWLYGLLGGFMAGLFEETGRFIAFKTVLRKKRGNDANALMYGAGHGGIEAAILLGTTMIGNLIVALQFNAGTAAPGAALDAAYMLMNTPPWLFLVGAIERFSAVALHLSLSVLVWFAAKDGKRFWLYPLAILLHLIVDMVAVVLSGLGVNVWIIEASVFLLAAALVVIAVVVWKKNHKPAEAEQPEETPVEAQA
ncbi:MAG: YhfC family glutamic-type intramembrane protease [Eubacteriales bacterium]